MSLDLFRVSPPLPPRGAGRRLSALPLSVAAHFLVLVAVVVVPLLATGVLPQPPSEQVEWVVTPTAPSLPPAPAARTNRAPVPVAGNPDAAPLVVPSGIPAGDGLQRGAPVEDVGLPSNVIEGVEGGLPVAAAVTDTPPPPPATPLRARVDVREPQKLVDVRPIYPDVARAARVEGVVIVEAVIGPDGTIGEARVLRSRPLLDAAAVDAVRQWRYTPTLLNGVPVPVVITVTVNFTLR